MAIRFHVQVTLEIELDEADIRECLANDETVESMMRDTIQMVIDDDREIKGFVYHDTYIPSHEAFFAIVDAVKRQKEG